MAYCGLENISEATCISIVCGIVLQQTNCRGIMIIFQKIVKIVGDSDNLCIMKLSNGTSRLKLKRFHLAKTDDKI